MENKRKAGNPNEVAGLVDGEDRVAKRQKQHPTSQPPSSFDLFQGESPESTTAYGLSFLEQLRRTNDKNGRLVAVYFESLLPRAQNEDYYKKIRMPVSLEIIEQKLHNREFPNLAALESYFKRMITNAKEYYNRGSEVYENAERVRKALSNYMVKTNPAYKLIPGYSCQPTPISLEGESQTPARRQSRAVSKDEEDAEGEDDDDSEDADDGGEEDEKQEEEDEDSDAGPRASRRGSRRSHRNSIQLVQKSKERYIPKKAKPDHEYEDVEYSRLDFQQAQEKIVEEMIREEDEDEPGWMKYDAFLNLPPRSLKEYFSVITDPLSLRGLQKLVKGIHGRQPPTGVSDFQSWAAFEEKACLLWNNAHYFNEEGSPIYELATQLQAAFEEQLKKAKAAVPEPVRPKIKIKSAQTQSPAPQSGTKKITIHVGGSRGSAAPSPVMRSASQTGDLSAAGTPQNGGSAEAANGASPAAMKAGQQEGTPGNNASMAPTPGGAQPGPATMHQPNGASAHPGQVTNGVAVAQPGAEQNEPQRVQPSPVYDKIVRAPSKTAADALIKNLILRTHPGIHTEKPFSVEFPADPVLAQRCVNVTVPNYNHKVQVVLTMAPLEEQSRQFKLFVIFNGVTLGRVGPYPGQNVDPLQYPPGSSVFEGVLARGLNTIDVQICAALPRDEWVPNGTTCEVEKLTVTVHMLS